jgi:hypothetical protein
MDVPFALVIWTRVQTNGEVRWFHWSHTEICTVHISDVLFVQHVCELLPDYFSPSPHLMHAKRPWHFTVSIHAPFLPVGNLKSAHVLEIVAGLLEPCQVWRPPFLALLPANPTQIRPSSSKS